MKKFAYPLLDFGFELYAGQSLVDEQDSSTVTVKNNAKIAIAKRFILRLIFIKI